MTFFCQRVESHQFLLGKYLESLSINHSSSEGGVIFVPWLLKLSRVFVVLQLAWAHISPQMSWITLSGLAPFPGCQGFPGKIPNGPAHSVIFFNMSGLEVLACNFNTDFNYVITTLQLCPSLNH